MDTIERLSDGTIPYRSFYARYIESNWPAIITNVSNEWECSKNWVLRNFLSDESFQTSVINFDYLKHKISNRLVPVTNCSGYFKQNSVMEMHFHNFLEYWEGQHKTGTHSVDSIKECNSLYLKDWHLKAQLPSYEFYKVPDYFCSDWLNEYLVKHNRDDYRFVYMGPKNSWTPFHVDVFGSFSWSTNVCGCKKWILLPPGEQYKIADRFGNIAYNVSEKLLYENNVNFFVIYQKENEAVFVPSGWYHQVWNITDTISVNHNWFNAANIKYIWCNISENLRKVIYEINDLRKNCNFVSTCQEILKANFGLSISGFLDILCFIAETRLCLLKDGHQKSCLSGTKKPSDFYLNKNHINNDLKNINILLKVMAQDKIVYNCSMLYERCIRYIDLSNPCNKQKIRT
ncbi:2-oxoglutarate and iron-dependent oxygenase JMJD4 homolog isoform X1 [Anastrepha obliqua]|uniref:2-oxoglutarate and iron-dependent oxygenase JMJD4 homolog isoform X1 n=2 Tax=Anastrepha obliqua TaxID=95512 RepID=UPI0024094BD3|nr:2-oxoglutarate and iron-dependent oxygenase JMJD4 homolog isoform X1 [Anastrepha obliqua]